MLFFSLNTMMVVVEPQITAVQGEVLQYGVDTNVSPVMALSWCHGVWNIHINNSLSFTGRII